MRRGFTVVELVITMAVVSILLVIAVVGLNGVQANARDSERESDINAIARGLEQRYTNGNTYMTNTANPAEGVKGTYPSVNEMLHILGEDRAAQGFTPGQVAGGYATKVLPGTTDSVFKTPSKGNDDFYLVCVYACQPVGTASQIQQAYTYTNDRYLYEPYLENGSYCYSGGCVGYNLYWKKESSNWALQTVRSK